MTTKKSVTGAQGDEVVRQANEKKVSRRQFQEALDSGSFGRFLESLKLERKDVVPPEGARVYVLKVKFEQGREWQDAVNAAGPDTPDNCNVRKVGDQYPPAGKGIIEEELILLNFPKGGGSWGKATAWAETQSLKRTNPRQVFAIGEQHPKFHEQIGQDPMYVAATKDCSFVGLRYACYVWWRGSKREVDLGWVMDCDGVHGWFAFRR